MERPESVATARELSRIGMVVCEPLNIVFQCIEAGRRQDSGLAHGPSIHSAEAPHTFQ